MTIDELLPHLRQLEQELHHIDTRRNPARLDERLHPEFVEFGRWGCRYGRADVLREFSSGDELGNIHAADFAVAEIADGIGLVPHRSAHEDLAGNVFRHTLRSSLWVRTPSG